jgi:hypothetical protein
MSEPPKLPPSGDYDVGYAKPPRNTRFKPGQSGNPRGRPKGAKNKGPKSLTKLRDLAIREAYREVTIQDKQGPVSVPVVQAAFRSLALNAAKGNVSAHRLLLEITSRAEADELKERLETFQKFSAYKKKKLAELEACKSRGETPPLMLPHPDDIEIDYETGEVTVHGPFNEDDLANWNRLHGIIEQLGAEIGLYKKELEDLEGGDDSVAWIREEIEGHQYIILTAALSILRRWKLPLIKMFRPHVPLIELKHHFENGTDPKPPKRFEKIARTVPR